MNALFITQLASSLKPPAKEVMQTAPPISPVFPNEAAQSDACIMHLQEGLS
jgi:hypothetical protein